MGRMAWYGESGISANVQQGVSILEPCVCTGWHEVGAVEGQVMVVAFVLVPKRQLSRLRWIEGSGLCRS